MEIEAKFNVPTAAVLNQISGLPQLAGYSVLPGKIKPLHDCYLDTPRRRIFNNGYALRRRKQADGDWVISLKALGGADGAIHRREEIETKLVPQLKDKAPSEWKQSDVYAQLRAMLGNATLDILFCLKQTRTVHRLADNKRIVAELSLDEVIVPHSENEFLFYEVEVELKKDGTEADLQKIATWLQDNFLLPAEKRSKFERALELIDMPASKNAILSDAERYVLKRVITVDAGTDTYARRAQALLAIDEGTAGAKAAADSDLSERQVRHWRAEFKKHGVRIFPERVLEKAMYRELPPAPAITATESAPQAARKLLWHTVQQFRHAELGARLMFKSVLLDGMLLVTRKLSVGIQDFEAFSAANLDEDFLAPLDELLSLTTAARDTLALLERTESFFAGSKSLKADGFLESGAQKFADCATDLRSFFDSETFAQFQNDLDTLLQTPGTWNAEHQPPIRLIAPIMLYLRLADVLSLPTDTGIPQNTADALAQTEQYSATLDILHSLLDKDSTRLSKPVLRLHAELQEYAGLSHAENMLQTYLADSTPPPADSAAVQAYLATITAERAQSHTALAEKWAVVTGEKYWFKVGNAVKRL